ncbi:MAG: type II secretion system F family protein [Planctomycetota bacterium]
MIGSADHRRALVYGQLATLEKAGVSIVDSVERVARKGGFGARMLGDVVAPLRGGESIGEAFARAESISRLEAQVIGSGAKAGSLPKVFERLAKTYEGRANLKRNYAARLAYPVFLIHAAIVLPSIPLLILKGPSAFLTATLVPFAILYGLVLGSYLLYSAGKARMPWVLDGILVRIPVISAIERRASLAEGLRALELLYGNGVSLLEALETARDVTPNLVVAQVFQRLSDRLARGDDFGDALLAEDPGFVPDYVLELGSTGASTGQLEELLAKANERLEDDVALARSLMVKVVAGAVFAFAACVVAYQVLSFWSNLMGNINKITGGR